MLTWMERERQDKGMGGGNSAFNFHCSHPPRMDITIPFQAPFLRWSPYADGLPTAGWNASGLSYGQHSPLGTNSTVAFRWTQASGTSLELQFNGLSLFIHRPIHSTHLTDK